MDIRFVQVTATAGTAEEAERLAAVALEGRLAACVQVVGPIASRYRWKGAVEHAEEWLLLVKTREDRFDELARVLKEAHSYDVPEITAVPITQGDGAYLRWIEEETAPH